MIFQYQVFMVEVMLNKNMIIQASQGLVWGIFEKTGRYYCAKYLVLRDFFCKFLEQYPQLDNRINFFKIKRIWTLNQIIFS